MSLLPARMKKIQSKMKGDRGVTTLFIDLSHAQGQLRVVTTLFIDFSHAQGQLTPKSVMESCRNSNPSKLSWLTLLPARMKKIHWKMKALERSQRFSHYKSMGIFPNTQGLLIPLFHTGPESHELPRIDKYLDSCLNRTQFVKILTDSQSP